MNVTEKDLLEYTAECCKEIGQRIQRLRVAKNLQLIDVATCLGIGRIQLYRIESGEANCKIAHLYILAQLLECSVDYLLFGNVFTMTREQKEAIEHLMDTFDVLKNK